jgi:peptidoglycan/xylan/chitin deacetylase (PgdA/CDA1 family)
MPESKSWESVPLAPANKAPAAPIYPWPGRFRAAMFLSLDVDAESAWTSKDPAHAERLVTMSFGGYEGRVGTPKLLELLGKLGLKATFFITGWSVEAHPAMAEAILKGGHEIGHHGFHHLLPDPGDPAIQEELERGFATLKRRLGVLHPQVSGRPMRFRLLREFLEYALAHLVELVLPHREDMLARKDRARREAGAQTVHPIVIARRHRELDHAGAAIIADHFARCEARQDKAREGEAA